MIERRISREQMFMRFAETAAQRSTCMRRAVGAVVVTGNRLISIGYNGAPSGEPHCLGKDCVPPGQTGCTRAIHAEANAIKFIPTEFERVSKTMYTTESPCLACASMLVEFKFSTLYYLNEYRLDTGIKLLLDNATKVYRMTPAGIIVQKCLDRDRKLCEVYQFD